MKKEEVLKKWPLAGNAHISDYLAKKIAKGNAGGTYIFNGPSDLGKTTTAFYFAKSLMCVDKDKAPCGNCPACSQFRKARDSEDSIMHSDFYLIKKEAGKKNISIEQVRNFINSLSLSSFLNSYKIGVIKGADSLNSQSANALLKTLEEPRKDVIIILITNNLESLPQTIVSRSQVLNFRPVKSDDIYNYLIKEHQATRSAAKNLSRLCLGRPALAVKFLQDKDFYESYLEIVSSFLGFFEKDINSRFADIEKLIGSGQKQEAVKTAVKIVGVWQGVVRDALLSHFNHQDLVQHEVRKIEIERIKVKTRPVHLLSINNILEESNGFLKANVNPRLVLENIAINI